MPSFPAANYLLCEEVFCVIIPESCYIKWHSGVQGPNQRVEESYHNWIREKNQPEDEFHYFQNSKGTHQSINESSWALSNSLSSVSSVWIEIFSISLSSICKSKYYETYSCVSWLYEIEWKQKEVQWSGNNSSTNFPMKLFIESLSTSVMQTGRPDLTYHFNF